MGFNQNTKKLLIALLLVITGVAVALYGGWRLADG